jgi:hypothetical protein
MRILLDEDLPWPLTRLLALAAIDFDVFLTMDGNLEFLQNLATLPIAVLVVEAVSNRMRDLEPLVPAILAALATLTSRSLRRVGGG